MRRTRAAAGRSRALAILFGLLLVALSGALCATASAQTLTFPQLTGRVVDEAGILDAGTREALTQKLAALEAKTTDQLVVVTLRSLRGTSIDDYGYQLGRNWGIGRQGKNNGALLIVAPNERKVRIEVGYGREGELTDAVSRLIIENSILPRFRANDYPGGITRGVDDIIAVLSGHADDYKQRAASRPESKPAALDIGTLILIAIIGFLLIRFITRSMFTPTRRKASRWGSSSGPIFFPSSESWGSGSSSWSSGSSDSGFSGGGGSFGGGGASGSW